MSTIQSHMLGNAAQGRGSQAPMFDLAYGGQNGFSPVYSEYINTQQHVRMNVMPILMQAPTAMLNMPDANNWVGILRALIEVHSMRITGLNQTLEVSTVTTDMGAGGQMTEDPSDVKMSPINLTLGLNEKFGQPISKYIQNNIRFFIKDEHAKIPLYNTIPGIQQITEWTQEKYSFSVLFIEPDQTKLRVQRAWLGANMYPKGTGDITAQKDMNAGGEQVNYDIQLAGFYQYGLGVDALAQKVLDSISLVGANPNARPAFLDSIDPNVAALSQGYANQIADLAQGSIKV